MDGKDPEKEENRESRPGPHSWSFQKEQKDPKTKQDEKENPSLRKEGKIYMAGIDPKSVNDEDGNERKAKGAAHLGLNRVSLLTGFGQPARADILSSLLVFLEPPPTAESD